MRFGLYKLNRRTLPLLKEAAEDFKRAVAADPKYVSAYAALADVYALLPQYGAPNASVLADTARSYAEGALRLDPNSAEAHAALGTILCYLDWKYPDAERELKRAIQLNPNYATAHQWYAELLMIVGRNAEAVREAQRAVALDPLSPLQHSILANALNATDTASALVEFKQSLQLDSTFQRTYADLLSFYLANRRFNDAAALSARASRITGSSNDSAVIVLLKDIDRNPALRTALLRQLEDSERKVSTGGRASVINGLRHAVLEDPDGAFRWWNRAIDQLEPNAGWIRVVTNNMPIREDPRFAILMRRLDRN
jgi:tetratricopeptide (TPR) repeat protein